MNIENLVMSKFSGIKTTAMFTFPVPLNLL